MTPPGDASNAPTSPLAVQTITADEHRELLATRRSASFLQTPAWGEVKAEWTAESVGWHRTDPATGATALVGAGLVLHRALPVLGRTLAYLPEGPVIDWEADDLGAWLTPLVEHLRAGGAFAVRLGPPVVTARWGAQQVKDGLADDDVPRLTALPPRHRSREGGRVVSQLQQLGWQPLTSEGGFSAGQPPYNFHLPLRHPDGTARTEDEVLAGMNQQWRRNIRKADKAGVTVRVAGTNSEPDPADGTAPSSPTGAAPVPSAADLDAFHALYTATAERDGFTPRPQAYFARMVTALAAESPERIRLYLAEHSGDLVAATIAVRVGGHVWYSYGASSTEKREVRGSNACQWAMMRDALAAGADVYDLRGITDTLDRDDEHAGLIQFKVGTGGEAVCYAGEWDLPLRPLLYRAFDLYLRRRGKG